MAEQTVFQLLAAPDVVHDEGDSRGRSFRRHDADVGRMRGSIQVTRSPAR
jgi:hypothetical protein